MVNKNLFNAQVAQYKINEITGEQKVEMNDGIMCYIPHLEIDGKTYQQTYSGYNLAYASSKNIGYPQYIKVEYIDTNNFIIKPTNKTATSSKMVRFSITAKPNTTYKVSLDVKRIGTFAGQSSVQCFGNDTYISGTTLNITTDTARYVMIVNTGTATKLGVQFNLMGGVAVGEENDIEFVVENFMITEGSATKAYEPYVGGIAAPNPNYPQDIVNAGDNGVNIEISSKNIFDKSQSVVAGINNETIVKFYGVTMFPAAYLATVFKPNTTYTMSYDVEYIYNTTNAYNNVVGFALVDSSGTYTQKNMYTTTYYPIGTKRSVYYHFTTPENINSGTWRFYVYTGLYYDEEGTRVSGEMIFRNIQVEEGEILSPYEPYIPPTALSIPATVEDLELRFAACDTYSSIYKDRLIVDGVSKKVIYRQYVDKLTITGEETGWYVWGIHDIGVAIACDLLKILTKEAMPKTKAYTQYSGFYCNYLREKALASLNVLGIEYHYINNLGWIAMNLGQDSLDTTKAKLQEYVANGNPLYIIYPLNTPVEHDITDTDIGQQLLHIIQPDNTGIIEISNSGDLTQKITAKYLTHS